jgi:hypothetical protein
VRKRKSLEPAYYCNPSNSSGFEPRENVSGLRNLWGQNLFETLFIINLGIYGAELVEHWFLLCFCGGIFGAQKRFAEYIFGVLKKKEESGE